MITSIILLLRKHATDRFLALAIMAFCLLSCKILLHTLGLWNTHVFRYFPLGIDLVIQPMIYFYVIRLISPKTQLKPIHILHLIPFIASEIYSLAVYFSVLSTSDPVVKDVIAESFHFNQVKHLEDYLTLVSTFAYLVGGLIRIKRYKTWLSNHISDSGYPTFNWLKTILIQLIVIGCVLLVNILLDRVFLGGSSNFLRWQLFYIVVAGHIYYLGFMGINRTDRFRHVQTPDPVKVQKLTSAQVDAIVSKIETALKEEQVYLNPQLSLAAFSKQIESSQSNLSYAINLHYQMSFRELINDYRVKEAKRKLKDASLAHLSILGIAYESGFNSEASFYRIFKKSTGQSPADYQKRGN